MKVVEKRIKEKARRLMTADIFTTDEVSYVAKMPPTPKYRLTLSSGERKDRYLGWWTTPRTKDA